MRLRVVPRKVEGELTQQMLVFICDYCDRPITDMGWGLIGWWADFQDDPHGRFTEPKVLHKGACDRAVFNKDTRARRNELNMWVEMSQQFVYWVNSLDGEQKERAIEELTDGSYF